MSLETHVEDLAKAAALADPHDLPALVALQEQFVNLAEQLEDPELRSLAERSTDAASLLEQIIMREIDDTEEALTRVHESIEYAQQVVDAIDNNRPVPTPPDSGTAEGSPAPAIDEDLLNAWVSSCSDALTDLEAQLLEIDSADDPAEPVAEVRRGIHTLKGECGVLSLGSAQKLCHEAESLIDRATDAGNPFPVDLILSLLDWMKGYVGELADNPAAPSPDHEGLLKQLIDGSGEPRPTTEPTTGKTVEDPQSADAVTPDAPTPQAEVDADEPVQFDSDIEPDENLNDFLCEAREHIAAAEEALLDLEHDFADAELINTVFRAFHTIKGVAGFMHLEPIVRLAHNAEFLLDEARKEAITLNSSYVDLILRSCDMISQLIGVLEGADPPTKGQLAELIDELQRATNGTVDETPPAANTGFPYPPLGEILVSMEIVSADQVADALNRQAEGASKLRDLLVDSGLTGVDAVEGELANPNSASAGSIRDMIVQLGFATATELAEAIEAKRDSDKRLGQLLNIDGKQLAPALREQRQMSRGEAEDDNASTDPGNKALAAPQAAATESNPQPAPEPTPTRPASPAKAATPAKQPDGATTRKRVAELNVKVNTVRLDNLVTMVGELVIAQQMVIQDDHIQQISDQRCQRNLGHSGKIIRDLQEVAMSLRMVTVKGIFQKMARLVRDVSTKAGKSIDFRMEGEDTELDRNVVEEIGDPLVHMIRNSCDHGIETADVRRAAGKSGTGTLTLRAYHEGGSIIIEVQDDGAGLNRDKILKKAIEKGIYTPDRDLADIPDGEVYGLIMQAGFSTADKVTDISGRGVGMDVVRRNIEGMRGKVEIDSTPGKGSTFRMALPLTMAIIDGMIVRVGTQRYVIPTLSIEQSYRPTPDEVHTVVGRGEMASVRGSLLPIYRLKQIFKLDEGLDDVSEAILVVLESGDSRCCVVVDEVLGQQQVVIKALGEGLDAVRGVSGGAILGDGRVALIIDVGGLVEEATTSDALLHETRELLQ